MIVRYFLLAGAMALAGLAAGYKLGTGAWPDASLWRRLADAESWRAAPGIADASQAPATTSGPRILYYRNPMGLPDTSPVPKKDWMGMDYIAVYEGEAVDDGTSVKVSLDRVQRAGVRSVAATPRTLARPIHAAGVVAVDERALRIVALRADGFIEKLYANTTGQTVRAGEPLFRLYSPDIVSALAIYQAAMISSGKKQGPEVRGAQQKLVNLGVPWDHVRSITAKDPLATAVDWPSPVDGTIMEKMVIEGEKAEAGRALFRIADLSHVWIMAEIAELDVGQIRVGDTAKIALSAMPGKTIMGNVTFVYPDLAKETRTGRIRIELPNLDGRLKPDMYADVVIDAGSGDGLRLAVPVDAVIDNGSRQVVIIDKGEGRFEPRPVELGMRGDGYVEIVAGLAEGELVVTAANFLIDAESNLRAALSAFTREPTALAGEAATAGPAAAQP